MLPLSRKSLLAIEAVLDVALHSRPDPVQAREITERQKVPQRYLEQIMQALVRADILRGVRGPRGGYRLARERRRISIDEIVRVISVLESPEDQATVRSDIGKQVVAPFCDKLTEQLMTALGKTTIEDLCKDVSASQAPSQAGDFTI